MNFNDEVATYLTQSIDLINCLNLKEISAAINTLLQVYRRDGYIFVFGNGGSAAAASHLVCDFININRNLDEKFKVVCLNDNTPSILAIANDIGYDEIFRLYLKSYLTPHDLALGISGSGNSKNVINAIEYANEQGALTLGLTGCDGGKLKSLARYFIHVPANDIQKVEDIHLMLIHLITQIIAQHLKIRD